MRKSRRITRRNAMTLAAGSSLALLLAHQARAQSTTSPGQTQTVDSAIQEIIVTATRRATDISEIPYNISAVSAADLETSNTTNLAGLANQIPGFNFEDRGARFLGADVPIIRGLNASAADRRGFVQEQLPVGTYIGNSPVPGFFPFDDVQRVEVLRGPQGTLYGAGALGGALRIIPNDPQLGSWSGEVKASGAYVDHSSDKDYATSGVVNIPIGPFVAVRVGGQYQHDAGFIDQKDILERNGSQVLGVPVLANPADVAGSSGVYYNRDDVNFTNTISAHASILVKPTDEFSVTLAYKYAKTFGADGPTATSDYAGGVSPFDPRVTLSPGGPYTLVQPSVEPYHRTSDLASLDASYDIGFATVSSTSTYYDTSGYTSIDALLGAFTLPPGILQYYVGNPINPRITNSQIYTDQDQTFTQEIRLVSKASDFLEYVVGVFYEHQDTNLNWNIYSPGTTAQATAAGSFPVSTTGPFGLEYTQYSHQPFEEKSVFGELTYHISPRWEVTGGARIFHQDFTQSQTFQSFPFEYGSSGTNSTNVTDHILKFNTSYEFIDKQHVYATYSQGFRRGGANAFPTGGPLAEPTSLSAYEPDKSNNYEIGVKGVLENGTRYTLDAFFINWEHPQIGTETPDGFYVVANGPGAHSKGLEFEVHTPLFVPQLVLSAGYAYADATLTTNLCVPTGDGNGGVRACGITGTAGSQLPGSAAHSGSVTLSFDQVLSANQHITYALNSTYKSSIINNLPTTRTPSIELPAYTLLNGNATYTWNKADFSVYGTNLLDHRAIYDQNGQSFHTVGNLALTNTISRPREVGLRVAYHF